VSVGRTADSSKFAAPKLLSPKLLCAPVLRGRTKGSSVALEDEVDVISQIDRHLTAQCVAHQTPLATEQEASVVDIALA